jgi:hypothetical protein
VSDAFLRRLERTAIVACLAMALIAAPVAGLYGSLAVIGGGLLAAASYAGVAAGVTALTAAAGAMAPSPQAPAAADSEPKRAQRPGAGTLAKVVLRYALLILLAYVMIARLRLHPVGVLAGASSVVAAAAFEAVRILVKKS